MESARSGQPLLVITGSSGLIGTRLVNALRSEYRIVGMDVKVSDENTANDDFHFVQCDLTDDESVSSSLSKIRSRFGGQVAGVIHLAAYYDFSGEPSPLYRTLTVDGTRRLLRGLRDFKIEQFLFSSSLLVMKSAEDDRPIDASSPLEAEWDYPQSKLAAEKVIAEEQGDYESLILRMAGAYDEDCHSIPLAQQIRRIYERQLESYFFPGDKTHGQSFIHLSDLVDCVRLSVERRKQLPSREVLVIGEGDVMSYEELQETIGELIYGHEWPTIRIPKAAAKAGAWIKDKLASSEREAPFIKPWMIDLADQNYPVNVRFARKQLGWEPQHSLRNSLPEIVGRLLQNPSKWYEINGLPLPAELPMVSTQSRESS